MLRFASIYYILRCNIISYFLPELMIKTKVMLLINICCFCVNWKQQSNKLDLLMLKTNFSLILFKPLET